MRGSKGRPPAARLASHSDHPTCSAAERAAGPGCQQGSFTCMLHILPGASSAQPPALCTTPADTPHLVAGAEEEGCEGEDHLGGKLVGEAPPAQHLRSSPRPTEGL